MKPSHLFCAATVVAASVAVLAGQTPLDKDAVDLRAHLGMQALDRYLETWNSRDAERWATSLNFPHVRPGPGAFELFKTPAQYVASVNFAATIATGWHHSEWTTRQVLQVGVDKVHIAGSWLRYTADDHPMVGTSVTYIITNQNGRWGVLSRFAAGPTGADVATVTANSRAALETVRTYFTAWNSHDPNALGAAMHFPFVRIGDNAVEVWNTSAEFLTGSEPGRQRTWYETRVEKADVAQASANGVNVAVTYSRRDRTGQILSKYDAVLLVVKRNSRWRVQAVSTMGT
jgi:hypothetical protein